MLIACFITAPNFVKSRQIGKTLVQERLAACVNIIRGVRSIFFWKGKVENTGECLLMIKTRKSHFARLAKRVRSLHPYSVPEIIALPITAGHRPYLNWIKDSVS